MDAVVGVLNKLGMDGTVFYQFVIFCAIYFISVPLFIRKLQAVLEEREANTTVLRDRAHKELEKCKELESQYEQKVAENHAQLQKNYHLQKAEVIQSERIKIRETEEELDQKLEKEKLQFVSELEAHRAEIQKETKGLTDQLIQRLS